jgi:UDP-N-acetylglucosamine 2-epimerase (non-hydrolysing)
LSEGIPAERIFITGNTIVDAVFQNLEMARRKATGEFSLGLREKHYFLVTVHRQENVDNKERFAGILEGLNRLCREYELPVVYPVHPRARKQLQMFGLDVGKVRLIEPLDYLTFLLLESQAKLVLTDSGGVQEETCVLKIPCVTLRYNTERPETLMIGSNVLAGTYPDTIVEKTEMMMSKPSDWGNPFGDGKAGERTVRILTEEYERGGLHPRSTKVLDFLPLVGACAE